MSSRLDKSWTVLASHQTPEADRCVDVFSRSDGTFGFEEFQTLSNIAADPRVGLLFVDFDTGTTLQLTGRARLLWDRQDFAELRGEERAVDIQIGEVVERAGHGPLGWRFREYSPFNPR